MIIANVRVNLSSAEVPSCTSIPKNAIGLKVHFQYADPLWDALSKTAVFRNGSKTLNSILTDDCAIIPHELLCKINDPIYVGLYGTDSNRSLAIPTVWAKLGEVSSSATPASSAATEATLPHWAQIQEKVDFLEQEMMTQEDLDYALLQAKESGDLDGPQGPQGPKGEQGDQGATGPAGYTPVLGKDYWTPNDKEIITTEAANIAANAIQHSSDIICTATGTHVYLDDASNRELRGMKLYGKTIQNGTPTLESPVELESVGDEGTVGMTLCGKNLLNYDAWKQQRTAVGGTAVFENNGVTLTATANDCYTQFDATRFPEDARIEVEEGEKITLSWEESSNLAGTVFLFPNGTGEKVGMALNAQTKKLTYTVPTGTTFLTFRFGVKNAGDTISYRNIQIEKSSTATAYEPYNAQTLTAQTPNGLPGIPVTSGGNYTDENGQQWICDEIDFARGKYVQRIETIESYAQEEITGTFISTTGELTTGAKVLYSISTPIETDLTAKELADYTTLHTNKPNTTICNDAGAGMEVDYVADTKLYIDTKIRGFISAL